MIVKRLLKGCNTCCRGQWKHGARRDISLVHFNMSVLDKYKIKFVIDKDDNWVTVQRIVDTDANFYLWGYFFPNTMNVNIFLESVLPDIENAINGLPFDENGGGFICFLTIGPTYSTLSGL